MNKSRALDVYRLHGSIEDLRFWIVWYLRRIILERCKLIRCEEVFLCDYIWVEASEGLQSRLASVNLRTSKVYECVTLEIESSKNEGCFFWCQRTFSCSPQLFWRNRPAETDTKERKLGHWYLMCQTCIM